MFALLLLTDGYLLAFSVAVGGELLASMTGDDDGVTQVMTSLFLKSLYLQSVVHVFTTCGIYGVFAVTLTWRVQNCLRML